MNFNNDGKNNFSYNPNEKPAHNPSEQVANKMFNTADRIDGAVNLDRKNIFNKAAVQFASGNYDKGQRLLETYGAWDDEVRDIAIEANKADQERVGEKPLDFDSAKAVFDSIADELDELGSLEDREGALIIRGIIRNTEMPGEKGVQGIDEAIKYLEDTMKSQHAILDSLPPELRNETLNQIKAKRSARDTLYAERQKRVDEIKQIERTKATEMTPNKALAGLENLYANAGVPEETPSRQGLLKRVGLMEKEELEIFGNELKKITVEYNRTQDKKTLDAALNDLTTKKFTKAEVEKRREQDRQSKLKEIRASLGINLSQEAEAETESVESPEIRLQKYKAYETHKSSVEKVVKNLQEARNTLENINNISSAFVMFEATISNLTQSADPDDIKKLRGQPINIEREKQMFGIEENSSEEYIRLREAQNALAEGKSVKEVLDTIEEWLGDKYGISKTETEDAKTLKDLDKLKISANVTAEETTDQSLVGTIKEIRGVGYHIPNVPQYNVKGELVNTFNKDINARPRVVTYKLNE